MLYPHSLLWHYLWVGTDVLLLALTLLTWRRQLYKLFPAFFVYLVFEVVQGFVLYAMDLTPGIGGDFYWSAESASVLIEVLVKLAAIWELYSRLVAARPAVAKVGNRLIACAWVALAALALFAAARAPSVDYALRFVSRSQILNEGMYLVEAGLLLFIYVFAAHYHLTWSRQQHGIALGLSISACVGVGVFAIYANRIFLEQWNYLNVFFGSVYQVCVLIWFYYLLSPTPQSATSTDDGISLESDGTRTNLRRLQRLQPAWFVRRSRSLP
jgi:hypothetical protein